MAVDVQIRRCSPTSMCSVGTPLEAMCTTPTCKSTKRWVFTTFSSSAWIYFLS